MPVQSPTSVTDVMCLNAELPMLMPAVKVSGRLFTHGGIDTLRIASLSKNAPCPMVVTLAGIDTLVSAGQDEKAYEPMLVKPEGRIKSTNELHS